MAVADHFKPDSATGIDNPRPRHSFDSDPVDLLAAMPQRKNATPAQIAPAWLLAQKPWIVPIPGTTKLSRVEENIGAAAFEFTPGDLREIDTAASKITISVINRIPQSGCTEGNGDRT